MYRIITYLSLSLIMMSLANVAYGQVNTFMTYNIRYDNEWDEDNSWEKRKADVVRLLDKYNPSTIAIQEGLLNQLKYIDSCMIDYCFVGIGREDGNEKGEYCAIFFDTTTYRIIADSTVWLSKTPESVSVGWDAALERICTFGLFENLTTNDKIWVLNTHFDHEGKTARYRSAKLIIELIININKENYPVVLMGDLNLTPDERPIKIISDQLDDASVISQKPFDGPIGTFNSFNDEIIIERIDYIFTKKLNVLSYSHINEKMKNNKHISDHLPVLISCQTIDN